MELCDFDVVLSLPAADPAHINVEEGPAFLRYLRWVLRKPARFNSWAAILLDSRVWLCAASKGRSGSWTLNRLLRRAAALTMAAGLVLHLVFVPSEHNPSDWPSRGGPGSWPSGLSRRRRTTPRRAVSRRERQDASIEATLRRLRETGMISSDSGDLSDGVSASIFSA